MARPTKYDPQFIEQVEKLCKLGATDKEISDFFNISERVLNYWKKKYPEFLQSLKKGKEIADANVASALYHRAIGYEHEDVDIKIYKGGIIKTKLTKYYPPDSIAGMFWLKNRSPEKWRDKHEVDHTTKGKPIGNPLLGGISKDVPEDNSTQ